MSKTITVSDVIKKLKKYPKEMQVVVAGFSATTPDFEIKSNAEYGITEKNFISITQLYNE